MFEKKDWKAMLTFANSIFIGWSWVHIDMNFFHVFLDVCGGVIAYFDQLPG
jgi:hypothetical protein